MFSCRRFIGLLGIVFSVSFRSTFAATGEAGWSIFEKARLSAEQGMVAMGADDPFLAAAFYNPALLGKKRTKELLCTTELGAVEDKMAGVYYAYPVRRATVMVGASYYDAGPVELSWLDETDTLNTRNVSLQRDAIGTVAYAYRMNKRVLVGGALKVAGSEIAETRSAAAAAVDAGVAYLPARNVTLSFAALNVGGSTSFIEKQSPLPQLISIGAGMYKPVAGGILYPAVVVNYNTVDGNTGFEGGVRFGSETIGMTVGYRSLAAENALLAGFDLAVGTIGFAYSYSPAQYLSPAHRANITYRFGAPETLSGKKKIYRPLNNSSSSDALYRMQLKQDQPWYK